MRKFIIMLLLAILVVPNNMAIDLKKDTLTQKGGARSVAPYVTAESANGIITITTKYYNGEVVVNIESLSGTSVIQENYVSGGITTFEIDVANLENGLYSISIGLECATYNGTFEITSNEV